VRQTITIALSGSAPLAATDAGQPVITVASREVALPRLGLGVASHGAPLTPAEVERLRALALDHLRVDLHFGADDVNAKLAQVATEARALGASLHVALHLSDDAAAD